MVKIRLARHGRKKQPSYKVVVIDSKSRARGLPIAYVGFFDPISKQSRLELEVIRHWIGQGAVMTDRVQHLVKLAEAALNS